MSDRGHHPGLDGVRGVAILLVLGQHAPTRPLIDGYVGVTVFFCLSGYLITTLLVRELHTGTIDLRAFYRRRAARLGPALLTVVAVTTVVLLIDRRDLSVGQVLAPAGAALAYATSLFDWTGHVFATYDYFNYTWSLSVEEQFYLLWPFALLWGYRRNPRPVRRAHRVPHRDHPGAQPLPRPESSRAVRSARVLRERHQCAAHPGRLLACDRRSQRLAVTDASATLRPVRCWRSPSCPSWHIGTTPTRTSLVIGRGDRTDARDVDRCRDPAAIGSWIAAGNRPDAVARRAVVLDLSLECPGADRDPSCARAHGASVISPGLPCSSCWLRRASGSSSAHCGPDSGEDLGCPAPLSRIQVLKKCRECRDRMRHSVARLR